MIAVGIEFAKAAYDWRHRPTEIFKSSLRTTPAFS